MSKTVKRVMTVTMVGLVAMLGATAEAHTLWVGGKPRRCSIDDIATAVVPNHWRDQSPKHFALAELTVTAKDVAIMCHDGEPELFDKEAILVGESLDGVITNKWTYDRAGRAMLRFHIDPVELFKTLGFCAKSELLDAQVLEMDAEYKLSDCVGKENTPLVCLNTVLLSTMQYTGCKPGGVLDADNCEPYICDQKPDEPIINEAHPGPLAK